MISLKDKKILFITTKNLDYIRNSQEIEMLKGYTDKLDIIGYTDKSYPKRLAKVYKDIILRDMSIYDVVFIGFAPQLILPMFNWKFKNNIVIIDFFISVYDTMVNDRKKIPKKSIPASLCKWLDKACIKSSKKVICDTNAHGDYFAEEFKVDRRKIKTMYLKADESLYYPRPQIKPDELKDKYVVLYFGSVLPLQGVEVIMDALKQLRYEEQIYFYFVGPIKDNIEKVYADNIEYIQWLPQEELAEYISRADLCLAGHFNKEIGKARRTIPGKAYIYELMQKPMILGDNPATHELFEEDDSHFFVEMSNPQALYDKIMELASGLTNE